MTLKLSIHILYNVCPILGSYKSVAQHFQSVAQHFETMATGLLNSSKRVLRNTRVMHFELNLMEHSNLWISRALDLIEGGCSLIFAVGFKSSPRKTCDGRPD